MTKYEVKYTSQFKKDYKLAQKRHLDMGILTDVIQKLADGEELPSEYHDHALSGDWRGHRECHLKPDWLLIYYKEESIVVLTLTRTGTHSDLFGK